jgi:hypothetical protein
MTTSKTKFSPSINILRDSEYLFNYIPTANSISAYNQIISNVKTGVKSHVIIGSYGTGKSSFLLAFKQTIESKQKHFNITPINKESKVDYEFINIVGQYASFEDFFINYYKLGKSSTTRDIINSIEKHYRVNKKAGKGLAILVDEFGKYLEFAAKNNPESELYFIQQLSEWVNDVEKETLFVTTLHQDFSAYSLNLNKHQRLEWEKVKGRIKVIPFNEPVEQLLNLAAERIFQKYSPITVDKNFDKLFSVIGKANAFPLKDYFELEFAKKIYPFDMVSASILTLSLQKYGQNERSLFSFIESNDHLSIGDFIENNSGYYNVPRVYDYLINGFYTYLTAKYNPDFTQWSAIRNALERVDGIFNDAQSQKDAEEIIKLIGLLNIFSTSSAKLDPYFYLNYAKLSLNIKKPESVFELLEKRKIIRYVNHSFKYILFEGTDLDIEIAIDDAGRLVEKVTNVVNHLNQYFEFPFISAKAEYYRKGTPRFFQFKLTEKPISLIPEGEIDGFINLIFSEDQTSNKKSQEHSQRCNEAILFGYFKNTAEIKNTLFEIQKIKKVRDNNLDDKVASKELNSILNHYVNILNHQVLENIYNDNGHISWYFKGEKLKISNRQSFNKILSEICKQVYSGTPVFKNDLVNKTKISGQVANARKKLVERLLLKIDEKDLGFDSNEFPPEKSIYLTLLRETGIHKVEDKIGGLYKPTENSFFELWSVGESFLKSTRGSGRNLNEFISVLTNKPFKIKQGFLDYWIPIFLLAKSDEYALFEGDNYIPEISSDIFDLLNKRPSLFAIKAFDVVGVKLELFNRYRNFLNQSEDQKPNNKLFIQTIKPFLTFYKDLPEYAKKTNRISSKAIELRRVIANAKDPEKVFFEEFPLALGFTTQEIIDKPKQIEFFIKDLQNNIKIIRASYDGLVDRFEMYFINEILSITGKYPDYKHRINGRFQSLKKHLLMPNQKTFVSRLLSQIDDRTTWLNSISQTCIGKPLHSFIDSDEDLLYVKIKEMIFDLDNLTEISNEQVDDDKEEVLKLQVTSFNHGTTNNTLRIPKKKVKEVDKQIQKIKSILNLDKSSNIAILTKLLQEIINEK